MKNGEQPAFPQSPEKVPTNFPISGGLTKREYFAAMAMQGLLANQDYMQNMFEKTGDTIGSTVKASIIAADELLKQLES